MSEILATCVNGKPENTIPVSDRGLQYGDGVFETIAIRQGKPEYWLRHMSRLQAGCARLGIQPVKNALLAAEADSMISNVDRGVLKLIVTRGSSGRGYRATETENCTRLMQLHPWPEYPADCQIEGVKTRLCKMRLGYNPALAGIKHLNRLEQVIARQEWNDMDIMEGLLMDADDNLVEGTMSNLFIVKERVLLTPDLSRCGVAGIMRTIIQELAVQQGLDCHVGQVSKSALDQADEVFLSNSLIGIWPVKAVDETHYGIGDVTMRLQTLLPAESENVSAWLE